MITGNQCIAARGLLRWKQGDLSDAISKAGSKLSVTAITTFEKGGAIRQSNAALIVNAFAMAGVVFIKDGEISKAGGAGVRLAKGF